MEICLNMIVKNEARTIARCLDSASWLFTRFYIHDTGSTDNTVETIREWGENNKKPGRVDSFPFKDFGHNRTHALRSAVAYLEEQGRNENQCYILLLDADMMLKRGHEWDANSIDNKHIIHVIQKSSELSYPNIRMIRMDRAKTASYKGATHEFLDGGDKADPLYILPESVLYIQDIGDGGSKINKFERDKQLLMTSLQEDPTNRRTMFYLANTFRDLKDWHNAIDMYKKRIASEGWTEEVYMSYISLGDIYDILGDTNGVVAAWLMAHETNPQRLECLYRLVNYYRKRQKNKTAWMFLRYAYDVLQKFPQPQDSFLFVEHNVYTYKLKEEESILAYYNHERGLGKTACETLIKNMDVPESSRSLAQNNLRFYVIP